ncbi:DUF2635 domain-containing protein [Asticcacaulis sp. YBE204]|uniref:DUF2635 domain-containing protein n=1 Tax=Asticcacaulis sp. YBE204 TaxID=1282363 RepID=UPI0003C407DD|nr:DUF2635 domain-containing protein [Asticcacaulis sp. YBE204]ESQ78512.1 hypothetical protein AEYBE204_13250 [Asticcacaulis sp. YBE204]
MPQYLIKPTPGAKVRNPDQGGVLLTDEGWTGDWSPYWQKRLDDHEVTREEVVEAPEETPVPPVKTPATPKPKAE